MEKKKSVVLSVIALAVFVTLIVGATFAYFASQGGDPASADISVNTYTVDTFTFATGSPISFTLDQENFASGKGNQIGSTYAKATLTANNKTNTATEHYYLYLNIENNTFTYSIDENTPEIIMTVTDASGNEVTSISGLTHTSVTDASGASISGFDVTNKSGLITLFSNREITTTSSKEEQWNIKLTFVNYDASQNANAGKSLSAKVMIQKEEYKVLLADYVKSLYTGTQGENNIYYHDGNLENGINDGSYRYSGANPNNYVCFGSSETTCPTDNLYRIIGVIDGKVKLIKADYATSDLLGTDGDYYGIVTPDASYYKGSLTTINTYYWNYKATNAATNTWSTSLLNKTNLNTNFINKIGETWASKIATTTWKVGGNTTTNIRDVIPSVAYQNEIVNPVTTYTTDNATQYSAKIGLMYVSDYGFAADPSAWTTTLINYSVRVNGSTIRSLNWMYMGSYEWTLSRSAAHSGNAFDVEDGGRVDNSYVYDNFAVRPSFNLESSITYVSGTGTSSDPIRIN